MRDLRYTTSVAGSLRTINFFDGDQAHTYAYGPRSPIPYDTDGWDKFEYRLPDSTRYTHPTREGCLLMILKHFFTET